MLRRCPGQDSRTVYAETIRCGCCEQDAEIFSDEASVVCPNCRQRIVRERRPSCADWCRAARECTGR